MPELIPRNILPNELQGCAPSCKDVSGGACTRCELTNAISQAGRTSSAQLQLQIHPGNIMDPHLHGGRSCPAHGRAGG